MSIPTTPTDRDYAAAITDAASSAQRALDEARIPLHILLTAQFGELNENQEEMLGAAAAALDRIGQEIGALRAIAESEHDAPSVATETVRVGDVVRALQPELREQASRSGVLLTVDIEPALPSARGSAAHLRDGMRLAVTDDIRYALPGSTVTIRVYSTPDEIVVTSCCGADRSVSGSLLLAARLLRAQGARLEHGDGRTTMSIPRR